MEQSFWESNLFQTLVMIITVFVTGIIYVLNKRSTLQAAATILKLQIKDIEENIEVLKAEAIVGNSLSEQPLYYSKIIFEENKWEKYSHMFANKLSASDFETIDNFFKVAQEIKTQQVYIKMKIQESVNLKCFHYYQQQYNRINQTVLDKNENKEQLCIMDLQYTKQLYNNSSFHIETWIPIEFRYGLEKGLNRYQKLSGSQAFHRLCKKGQIND